MQSLTKGEGEYKMDNQVQKLEYILPDDYVEEEAEEVLEEETEETTDVDLEETETDETEEVSEEVEETEETQGEVQDVETLDDLEVKFLHETKKLKDIPKEELKTYVQKGMNYDKVNEKFSQVNEKFERVKELAELYKMSDAEMLDILFDNYFESAAETEGISKEQVKSRYEQTKKDATQKMYAKFTDKYQDVKSDDIPSEVWEAVKNGEDLTKAYEEHLTNKKATEKDNEVQQLKKTIAELEGKIKLKTQNEKVKSKAVVKSTAKNGSDETDGDEFLDGFWNS